MSLTFWMKRIRGQYLKSVTAKLPPTSTVTNICNQHQSLLSLRVQVAHVAKSFGFELENFNFFDYRLIINWLKFLHAKFLYNISILKMESQENGCKSKVNVDRLRIGTGVWRPVRSWMTEAGVPTYTLRSLSQQSVSEWYWVFLLWLWSIIFLPFVNLNNKISDHIFIFSVDYLHVCFNHFKWSILWKIVTFDHSYRLLSSYRNFIFDLQ